MLHTFGGSAGAHASADETLGFNSQAPFGLLKIETGLSKERLIR